MSLDLVQSEETPSLLGLGAYKELYLVQDMRDTDEDFTVKELRTPGKVFPYTFNVASLRTDPNFQNRNEKFSEISVQRILHAVENGSFNWAAFDPVVIWQNPNDNQFYILSGHSRTEAFWRLAKEGAKVDGRGFTKIPARIFEGSYDEAKFFAQNSNTLSTKETTTERAAYFHKLLQLTEGNKKEIAKIKDECKQAEGKEFKNVWALAHLSPEGAAFSLVKELEEKENAATVKGLGDVENFNTALILAVWVGNLRAAFPQLTNDHENEIFYFLIRGGYPSKYKTYTELKDTISALVAARTDSDGNFNAAKKINIERSSEELTHEKQYQFELSELDKEIKKSESKYTKFLQDLIKKHESDKNFSIDDYLKQLKEFLSAVIYDRRKKIQFEKKHGLYTQADKDTQTLFNFDGLGNLPKTLKQQLIRGLRGIEALRDPELFNHAESELKCAGLMPSYSRLRDYDSLIASAANDVEQYGRGLKDTLPLLAECVRDSLPQVVKLAKHLKADTMLQSCFNIWHWLHTNVRYNYDDKNKEQVRTAARSWKDRARGVDCDCLSVFTAALLFDMGYTPHFEIVAFNGNDSYGHIFVNCGGIVVDRVMGEFNKRPAFISKTLNMEIPVYKLSGCNGSSLEGLKGLTKDLLMKVATNTATPKERVDFKKARVLVSLEGHPVEYRAASMLMPYVVDIDERDGGFYFDNPTIAGLAVHLDRELQRAEINGLSGPELEGILKKIKKGIQKAAQTVAKATTSVVKATAKAATTVAKTTAKVATTAAKATATAAKATVKATGQAVANTTKAVVNTTKAAANVVKAGVQAASGNTTAAKATMQKAGQQVATAAKATVQSVAKPVATVTKAAVTTTKDVVKNAVVEPTKAVVKTAVTTTKDVVKNAVVEPTKAVVKAAVNTTKTVVSAAGKLIKVIFVKINPVTVLMRNSLRLLVAINFLGIATRLNISNTTEADAIKEGYTKTDYANSAKAKKRVINFVVKMGGSKSKIEKAIVAGAKKKPLFKGDYKDTQTISDDGTLSGLGEAVTIGSCLAAVGAFFVKIWNWVKNIAIKIKDSKFVKAVTNVVKAVTNKNTADKTEPEITSDNTPITNNTSSGNFPWWLVAIVGGVAVVGATDYKRKQKDI